MTPQERHQLYLENINPALDRLARLICEASGIEDKVLEQSRYQDLVMFYEEQVNLGHWHPALTEAVADFTAIREPAAAIPYYHLALNQANALNDDTHTILIALAKVLFELGQTEQAEACLRDGRTKALSLGAEDYVRQADRILRERSV